MRQNFIKINVFKSKNVKSNKNVKYQSNDAKFRQSQNCTAFPHFISKSQLKLSKKECATEKKFYSTKKLQKIIIIVFSFLLLCLPFLQCSSARENKNFY